MAAVDLLFLKSHLRPTTDLRTAGMMALFVLSCLIFVSIAQALRSTIAQLNAANERTEFLNQELLHRMRNTLTVINSLAFQTYRAEPSDFPNVFSKRMAALAGGLDALTKDLGKDVELRVVIDNAIRPFMHDDCIVVTGPAFTIPEDTCIPLTLAIHELCTNAVKYGALSVSGGRVHIQSFEANGSVQLTWQESGGPHVGQPSQKGLGSALLNHPKLGPAKSTFLHEGLRCEMLLAVWS